MQRRRHRHCRRRRSVRDRPRWRSPCSRPRAASDVMRSRTFSNSTVAAAVVVAARACRAWAGSRDRARCRASPPQRSPVPISICRNLSAASAGRPAVRGWWVRGWAMSPMASSFSTRDRGTSRVCASCSRQAGDFHQHREFLRLADPGLEPLPGAFGMKVVGAWRGEDVHFLADPFAAAALLQIGVQRREHVAQLGGRRQGRRWSAPASAGGATSR